jgi:lipid A 3-O-deacylase
MRKLICLLFVVELMLMVTPEISYGYEGEKDAVQSQTAMPKLEIESEYMAPVEESRQLDTVSLNLLLGNESFHNPQLAFYKGITITHAWGDTTRMGVTHENSAFGIGPVYLLRYQPFQWERASLSFDVSGGLIFYNEKFPAGGDFYNFMWRIGPKFTYQISDNLWVNIGYKVMHVSNGQWSDSVSTNHNPAYNACGISVSVTTKI